MGFVLASIEDPENIEPLREAYCQIIEYHVNYLDRQATVVIGVWRTQSAHASKKKFASVINVTLSPEWAEKWLAKRKAEAMTLEQEQQLLEAACVKLLEKA